MSGISMLQRWKCCTERMMTLKKLGWNEDIQAEITMFIIKMGQEKNTTVRSIENSRKKWQIWGCKMI